MRCQVASQSTSEGAKNDRLFCFPFNIPDDRLLPHWQACHRGVYAGFVHSKMTSSECDCGCGFSGAAMDCTAARGAPANA